MKDVDTAFIYIVLNFTQNEDACTRKVQYVTLGIIRAHKNLQNRGYLHKCSKIVSYA